MVKQWKKVKGEYGKENKAQKPITTQHSQENMMSCYQKEKSMELYYVWPLEIKSQAMTS